jgi:hypothetical protein
MEIIERFGQLVMKSDGDTATMTSYRGLIVLRAANALQKIAERPWCHRAWVVQEISTPYREGILTSVWCGHKRIPWHYFLLADVASHQVLTETDIDTYLTVHDYRVGFLSQLNGQRQNSKDNTKSDSDLYPPLNLLDLL